MKRRLNVMTGIKILKAYFFILLGIMTSGQVHSQSSKVAKAVPHSVLSVGNSATIGNVTYSYSIGEAIVFTGIYSSNNGFATQGFQQPMICRTTPVISAYNQTSCILPYTLKTDSLFNVYKWRMGTSVIANGVNFTYNPVTDGDYTVFVGDSTGCFLTSALVNVDLSGKNIIPAITAYGTAGDDTLLLSTPAKTYQWYVITSKDGVHRAITGEISNSYRPLYNGNYYVKVNTQDNCVSYSSYYLVNNNANEDISRYNLSMTDSTIDIKIIKPIIKHALSVYPVPARDKINIDYESPDLNAVTFNFYNVNGVLVDSKQINNKEGKIHYVFESNNLSAGKYVLSVVDGDKKSIQNIVFE